MSESVTPHSYVFYDLATGQIRQAGLVPSTDSAQQTPPDGQGVVLFDEPLDVRDLVQNKRINPTDLTVEPKPATAPLAPATDTTFTGDPWSFTDGRV